MSEAKNPFKKDAVVKKDNSPIGQAAKHLNEKLYKGKKHSNPPAW